MKKEKLLFVVICIMLVVSSACFGCYFAMVLPWEASTPETTQPFLSAEPSTPAVTTTAPAETTMPPTTAAPTIPTTVPPTTVPTTPTTVPTEPTAPPTEPTQPPTEPTQPPTEPTQPPVEITLSAKQAMVYDMSAEELLYLYGDLDQAVEPASITKLFTAYVALQYLSPDTLMTAGEEVNWIDPGSSRAYVYKGHKLSVELCIQGMIIPSGNDAAYVLAVNAGRVIAGDPNISTKGAYDAFVAEMNRQAAELGMTGTHFVNPDGMNEDGHYTTLRDLLVMAKLAMDEPLIMEAAKIPHMRAIFPSGHFAEWTNSNQLLNPKSEEFYRAEAIGLKTGSTSTAGRCLLSLFQCEDRILLVCVMGCPTNNDRYYDTLALYEAFR